MSFDRPEDFEAVAFLVIAALFLTAEWRRPRGAIGRREIVLDIVSIALLDLSSRAARSVLGGFFDSGGPGVLPDASPALRVLLVVLLSDFALYWVHRLMHHRWFWRCHVWHHSASTLYTLSGFRASVVHTFLFLTPILALAIGVFRLAVFEMAAVLLVAAFFQIWTHTSARVSLGVLDSVVVSPRTHRVHHLVVLGGSSNTHAQAKTADRCVTPARRTRSTPFAGRSLRSPVFAGARASRPFRRAPLGAMDIPANFGMLLTVWDRLFGTWRSPDSVPDEEAIGAPVVATVRDRARAMLGI